MYVTTSVFTNWLQCCTTAAFETGNIVYISTNSKMCTLYECLVCIKHMNICRLYSLSLLPKMVFIWNFKSNFICNLLPFISPLQIALQTTLLYNINPKFVSVLLISMSTCKLSRLWDNSISTKLDVNNYCIILWMQLEALRNNSRHAVSNAMETIYQAVTQVPKRHILFCEYVTRGMLCH